MNILFTRSFRNLRMGGVTIYVKQLIKYLDESKFNVINLHKIEKEQFLKNNELYKWNNIDVKIRLVLFYLAFPIKIITHKANIIHANPSLGFNALFRDGCFLIIAKIFRMKTVVFIHGWDKKTESKIKGSKIWTDIFRKIYNSSDVIIVLANEFRQSLYQMGFTNKILVETTMVDDELIPMDKVQNKIAKSEDKNTIKILFLSRIEKTKGIYEAINAFCLLTKKYPNIEFDIAGDGPELSAVKSYAASLDINNINILGYVSGKMKQDVFLNSDIYLFPTYGEGLPISLLEAMAFGSAVVTRNEGGIPDFFINGKNGFITDSKSPDIFAGFIEKLIDDRKLLKKICQHNFDYACEHFLASKVVKRIETIYTNLL